MKYLSIDIETTGLNPNTDQILSIGAIIENTEQKLNYEEIPKFHAAIIQNNIRGNLYAISMNQNLIQLINTFVNSSKESQAKIINENKIQFYTQDTIVEALYYFYKNNLYYKKESTTFTNNYFYNNLSVSDIEPIAINCAGKNFGTFDKLFLEKLPKWSDYFKIRQRIIDPSILYTNWSDDNSLPSLSTCKKRANLKEEVSHNAIEDAWDIICLLRSQY